MQEWEAGGRCLDCSRVVWYLTLPMRQDLAVGFYAANVLMHDAAGVPDLLELGLSTWLIVILQSHIPLFRLE